RLLVLEAPIEAAHRALGRLGDVDDMGGPESLGREHPLGGPQQAVALGAGAALMGGPRPALVRLVGHRGSCLVGTDWRAQAGAVRGRRVCWVGRRERESGVEGKRADAGGAPAGKSTESRSKECKQ